MDAVMRMGGPSCKPELTYEELPAALGIAMALKAENFQIKELFDRHDVDKVVLSRPVAVGAVFANIKLGSVQENATAIARSLCVFFVQIKARAFFLKFVVPFE